MTQANPHDWRREPAIYGETGVYFAAEHLLDLVVTPAATGGVVADVVDADTVIWRGRYPTIRGAKTASIRAARRFLERRPHEPFPQQ
uniref:Uncharacterized protein n=1 Tax=Bosea sp. NBC_00436 TaxID=2969620 RepID=A0A9E7ZX22_9HYPH